MKTNTTYYSKNNLLQSLSWSLPLLFFALSISLNAQTSSTTDASLIAGAGDGVTVKVIDNKGTIKYLQTNNGITSITSTSPANETRTTWQLGGALVDDTYIDVNENVFALDGIELIDTSVIAASTDATDQSDHGTGTGWTLLVRDEATGAVKKMKATDLIQSGHTEANAAAGDESAGAITITSTGLAAATGGALGKVWVYRNGAKLTAFTDYVVTDNTVTVTEAGWQLYEGDYFEVQWVK
jgi:hypothetical protein